NFQSDKESFWEPKTHRCLHIKRIEVVVHGYLVDICGLCIGRFTLSKRTPAKLNPRQAGNGIVGVIPEIYRIIMFVIKSYWPLQAGSIRLSVKTQ
ncbi:MAG: hypothetical protein B1H40_04295, partial [Candidatus Latescibacteria bacterium 4484_181]